MPKYNVELEFWEFVDNVEAENEQEAIKNALIKLTNNPEDFFTAPDEIANIILDNFKTVSGKMFVPVRLGTLYKIIGRLVSLAIFL